MERLKGSDGPGTGLRSTHSAGSGVAVGVRWFSILIAREKSRRATLFRFPEAEEENGKPS